jgi:uncharacterized protein (TIGR00290 family)
MKAYFNWSGGKDAALALYHAQQDATLQIEALLCNVNAAHNRVAMHGVRRILLEQQAASLGLPLYTAELPEAPGMKDYERIMKWETKNLKDRGFEAALFGDIFLEDLRRYREKGLAEAGILGLFPLWQQDSRQLMHQFIELQFKAIVVCVNSAFLDAGFCGRLLDQSFIDDLPAGVDPCGENGEYHSFVFDGPIFKHSIPFHKGEVVYREYPAPVLDGDQCFSNEPQKAYGFYFQDLLPGAANG